MPTWIHELKHLKENSVQDLKVLSDKNFPQPHIIAQWLPCMKDLENRSSEMQDAARLHPPLSFSCMVTSMHFFSWTKSSFRTPWTCSLLTFLDDILCGNGAGSCSPCISAPFLSSGLHHLLSYCGLQLKVDLCMKVFSNFDLLEGGGRKDQYGTQYSTGLGTVGSCGNMMLISF